MALGNWGYASAGSQLGFAIGYALSRGTLLVSALLGVFVYREFNGADCKTWTVQLAALYLFFAAILLEAMILIQIDKDIILLKETHSYYKLHRHPHFEQVTDQDLEEKPQ